MAFVKHRGVLGTDTKHVARTELPPCTVSHLQNNPQSGGLQGVCRANCSGASVLLWPVAFKSGKLTKAALEDEHYTFQKQGP